MAVVDGLEATCKVTDDGFTGNEYLFAIIFQYAIGIIFDGIESGHI